MRFHSTGNTVSDVTFRDAAINGPAPDGGLYMPDITHVLPKAFFNNLADMSLQDIAYVVTDMILGDEIPSADLKQIVADSLDFDMPLVELAPGINSLELFHGPTLAFKDTGARFMLHILKHFYGKERIKVLVATTGDAGGAMADCFHDVAGVDVYILYPRGKVSHQQELQFATLGGNIHAIEVGGNFDDCQAMVKAAFRDNDLKHLKLVSANSINPARFLPQMIPFFHGYASVIRKCRKRPSGVMAAVPCGNLGNLCAGLIAKRIGLPIDRFIAVNNSNDVFARFLRMHDYSPSEVIHTIASAMDVGRPSNFARILDLYNTGGSTDFEAIGRDVAGVTVTDEDIRESMLECLSKYGYLVDPHGAAAYRALLAYREDGVAGFFMSTAHPAKFKRTVESIIGREIEVPKSLRTHAGENKRSVIIPPTVQALKKILLTT